MNSKLENRLPVGFYKHKKSSLVETLVQTAGIENFVRNTLWSQNGLLKDRFEGKQQKHDNGVALTLRSQPVIVWKPDLKTGCQFDFYKHPRKLISCCWM